MELRLKAEDVPGATEDPRGSQEDGALAAWIGTHQLWLWRWLRVLGCPHELSEDLLQDVFLVALEKKIPALPPAACRAWLKETARRMFLGQLRKLGRRPKAWDPQRIEVALADQRIASDGYLETLRECLAELTPRERDALSMRYGRRCSRQEMAAALGISGFGVKMLLRRLRNRLKACVEHRLQEGGT